MSNFASYIETRLCFVGGEKRLIQPRIDAALQNSTAEIYLKMFKTAYQLAVNPTMPLKHFKVLVKCQRENGVVLVQGRDDNKAAREYIHYIATAVREKCAAIIASQNFMSLMSDGSQARKTGSEKEMILLRVERNGIPCYLIVSLLEMSRYGGVDADSIKKGIDSIFDEKNGVIKLQAKAYATKMVSATTDGASVNTGIYNGVLKQLSLNRDWLLMIHCANHRVELAFKSAIAESAFSACDEQYKTIYTLLRNSGKINAQVYAACKALGIEAHKKLPKIHGTRFVNHRRKGMKILVDMWPGLITAFENTLTDGSGAAETKAKIKGLLKTSQSYECFCKMASYIDVLEAAGPASLVFEGDGVMPYEIAGAIESTVVELNDLEANAGKDEELLNSQVAKFKVEGNGEIVGVYLKEGHGRKKPVNRECIDVSITGMKFSAKAREIAANAKKATVKKLKSLLLERFPETDNKLYHAMQIYDPQYWEDDVDYGVESLEIILDRFAVPLLEAGISTEHVFSEWKRFKLLARRQLMGLFAEPKVLWRQVLSFKRLQFPNLCLVIELLITIAGSNSAVERAFSVLTLLLNDRRLCMTHETMENLMIVKGNDKVWTEKEKKDILARSVDIYLEKRRKTKLSSAGIEGEPSSKKICLDKGRQFEDKNFEDSDQSETDRESNDSDFFT